MLKALNNFIGWLKSYGSCPSCGDSWWWKDHSTVPYESVGMLSFGVVICEECMETPEELDPEEVYQDLIRSSWTGRRASKARAALENYKSQALA